MLRGRKPKPASLKALHGTERKDRKRREPVPKPGALVPSSQIDETPHAREFWDHYLRSAPLAMLKPVDVPLLERLCIALAIARTAQEQVNKGGLVVRVGQVLDKKTGAEKSPGSFQQNPFLPIVNRQAEIARKIAAELGLPVTARARIDMNDPPPQATTTTKRKARNLDDIDSFIAANPQAVTLQ